MEHGPNTVLVGEPLQEIAEQLGIGDQLIFPQGAKKRFVLGGRPGGELKPLPLPMGPLELFRTPLLSGAAKLGLVGKMFAPAPELPSDVSVAEFFRRRFGSEVNERVAAAAISGIYAADPERLSAGSAFPNLVRSRGSFAAQIARRAVQRRAPRRRIGSFRGGLETLVRALADALPRGSVRLETQVTGLRTSESGVFIGFAGGGEERFDEVVITLPAAAAARLLQDIAPQSSEPVSAIPYVPIGVLHLTLPLADCGFPLDGFGMLIPPVFGKGVLGVVFSSSIFPDNAPAGHALLTCFTGGALFPAMADVTNGAVRESTLAEIARHLSFQSAPKILSARCLPAAIPSFPVGHPALVRSLEEALAHEPRISLLAQWQGGVGIPDRIRLACELATRKASATSSRA